MNREQVRSAWRWVYWKMWDDVDLIMDKFIEQDQVTEAMIERAAKAMAEMVGAPVQEGYRVTAERLLRAALGGS